MTSTLERFRVRWLRLVLLALLGVLGSSLPARAQAPAAGASADDVERAKESFRIGAGAYAAGEYLAAIAALDSAYAMAPLPAIAFSLAQAERRQYFVDRRPEHLVRSLSLFRRYLEQVPSGGRRADAIDALAQLEPLAARPPSLPPASDTRSTSTRLLVIAEAAGARVWIDDVELTGAMIREVAPGKHRVAVRAPGYHDAEREVVAVLGELIPVSMVLAERPGTLEVSAPTAAEIYVDGAFASLGGSRVPLQVSSGGHRVSVSLNGHRMASRKVDVPRGGRAQVSFELEPTAQRITSNVLLIGGGMALGTGTFLGLLAVQSEDAAQDFIAKRERENVSVAELVRYRADVARRDRYRLMAGASFAASLGMLVTGLFLHELDEPRAEDLNRDIELGADIGPGHIGARLQGAF
jgi:PEGA domain-containing protein